MPVSIPAGVVRAVVPGIGAMRSNITRKPSGGENGRNLSAETAGPPHGAWRSCKGVSRVT